MSDKLKNMEKRSIDLVDQKVGEAMRTACEMMEKPDAAVVAVEDSTETGNTNASQKFNKGKTNDNFSQNLQIRSVPDDPSKSKGQNFSLSKCQSDGVPRDNGTQNEHRRPHKT